MPPIPQQPPTEKPIDVHEPGSSHPSLADTAEGGFDRGWFMGKWGVAWSTLPMWKDKKNVIIEYLPHSQDPRPAKFDSTVFYHKQSAADDSSPSTVRGTESLTAGANGATFDWRGKSYLFFVSSHWEVLGYGEESGVEWAVTYFSKTLFTPAGVDIYLRTTSTESLTKQALLDRIVTAVQHVEPLAQLTKDGFQVPGVIRGS